MAHEVDWTTFIVETFLEKLKDEITNEERYEQCANIMRTRAKGWSRTKQSMEFNLSMSTVDRRIKLMKKKYDIIQKKYPELGLPKRKYSKEEKWMDTH